MEHKSNLQLILKEKVAMIILLFKMLLINWKKWSRRSINFIIKQNSLLSAKKTFPVKVEKLKNLLKVSKAKMSFSYLIQVNYW